MNTGLLNTEILNSIILEDNIPVIMLSDTLTLTQLFSTSSLFRMEFKSKKTLSFPEPNYINQYPYNNTNSLPDYSHVNHNFSNSNRYSKMVLFDINFTLTYQQRKDINQYFIGNYYREFDIKIQDNIWRGYLTLNNKELFNENIKNEISDVTIQFEAMLVGKG
jgi:hypothetical protein